MAFKILIKATVSGTSVEEMADSAAVVAEYLDDIQKNTPEFLGFTLSADRKARTALFSIYVNKDDIKDAITAAYSWAVIAIGTREWATFACPAEITDVDN